MVLVFAPTSISSKKKSREFAFVREEPRARYKADCFTNIFV